MTSAGYFLPTRQVFLPTRKKSGTESPRQSLLAFSVELGSFTTGLMCTILSCHQSSWQPL